MRARLSPFVISEFAPYSFKERLPSEAESVATLTIAPSGVTAMSCCEDSGAWPLLEGSITAWSLGDGG
jgi:hypothetical protein